MTRDPARLLLFLAILWQIFGFRNLYPTVKVRPVTGVWKNLIPIPGKNGIESLMVRRSADGDSVDLGYDKIQTVYADYVKSLTEFAKLQAAENGFFFVENNLTTGRKTMRNIIYDNLSTLKIIEAKNDVTLYNAENVETSNSTYASLQPFEKSMFDILVTFRGLFFTEAKLVKLTENVFTPIAELRAQSLVTSQDVASSIRGSFTLQDISSSTNGTNCTCGWVDLERNTVNLTTKLVNLFTYPECDTVSKQVCKTDALLASVSPDAPDSANAIYMSYVDNTVKKDLNDHEIVQKIEIFGEIPTTTTTTTATPEPTVQSTTMSSGEQDFLTKLLMYGLIGLGVIIFIIGAICIAYRVTKWRILRGQGETDRPDEDKEWQPRSAGQNRKDIDPKLARRISMYLMKRATQAERGATESDRVVPAKTRPEDAKRRGRSARAQGKSRKDRDGSEPATAKSSRQTPGADGSRVKSSRRKEKVEEKVEEKTQKSEKAARRRSQSRVREDGRRPSWAKSGRGRDSEKKDSESTPQSARRRSRDRSRSDLKSGSRDRNTGSAPGTGSKSARRRSQYARESGKSRKRLAYEESGSGSEEDSVQEGRNSDDETLSNSGETSSENTHKNKNCRVKCRNMQAVPHDCNMSYSDCDCCSSRGTDSFESSSEEESS